MGSLGFVIVGLSIVSVCFSKAEVVNCLRARGGEREGVGGWRLEGGQNRANPKPSLGLT